MSGKIQSATFQVVNTIAFAVFCYFLGGSISILLTCAIFDLNIAQLSEVLDNPLSNDKPLLLTQAALFTTFSFVIIPSFYLLLLRRRPIQIQTNGSVRLLPILLTIVLAISVMPFLSILIELNGKIEFPSLLSGLEAYFREQEDSARQMTDVLLVFGGLPELAMAIVIMAVIPGFAEEFFFRGLIQTQLQDILKNQHYTIALAALLFSLLHFQFYGIIPRLAMGVLYGYIFFWSKNLVYPVVAHIMNNLIGVVSSYLFGPEIMDPKSGSSVPHALVLLSIMAVVLIVLYLRKNLRSASVTGFNRR